MTEMEKVRQDIIKGHCIACPATRKCNESCRIWREVEALKERGVV